MTKKKYTYVFDVAFSIESDEEDWNLVPQQELVKGLARRLANLIDSEDGTEPFGFVDRSTNE